MHGSRRPGIFNHTILLNIALRTATSQQYHRRPSRNGKRKVILRIGNLQTFNSVLLFEFTLQIASMLAMQPSSHTQHPASRPEQRKMNGASATAFESEEQEWRELFVDFGITRRVRKGNREFCVLKCRCVTKKYDSFTIPSLSNFRKSCDYCLRRRRVEVGFCGY